MVLVLVDDVARLSASHDPAEHALPHERHSVSQELAVSPLFEFGGLGVEALGVLVDRAAGAVVVAVGAAGA